MQRVSGRVSRIITSSVASLLARASSSQSFGTFSVQPNFRKLQQQGIPGDFPKWGSLGFCRTLGFASGFTPLQPKPLGSILDIERVKDRSSEDIASIWDDYHLGRGHIPASMKPKLYHLLEHRAANCRHFVIPLWRGSGYATMFAQVKACRQNLVGATSSHEENLGNAWACLIVYMRSNFHGDTSMTSLASCFEPSKCFEALTKLVPLTIAYNKSFQMPHMIFTGLEDYKARGTQAAPYFTVTFYTDFAESKDLVLIRGDIVFTSKLSDSEAKWLLETAQSFYLNDVRYKLVERFNKETREFEFKDVLQALNMPVL
ncbi:hypothetical protein CK203_084192 [Vitis vinifera]|uniref:ATP synthase mitochondrial F1 complex assembly factor 1 n=1 Tax=Vitis vinifera TaxID=29760 RepID=A0A438DRC0_VITVI|nr:hypothetical protein CK203_084192 [Vitis vinifera]